MTPSTYTVPTTTVTSTDNNLINVLVSIYRGYGMGDYVQMTSVLRHVRRYRPHWHIDLQVPNSVRGIGRGLAHNTFAYGEPYPSQRYDAEVIITLYDRYEAFRDRPNTRVTSCLQQHLSIPWDRNYGRYYIEVSSEVHTLVSEIIPRRAVAMHYCGDSAPDRKNLSHVQAAEICDMIRGLSYRSLLMDWRGEWPLKKRRNTYTTGGYPFSLKWGADPEMNTAVISQCAAFIGIDSGPGKCASATDTPSLIIWTGHHPALYHDPAPNTTHLMPHNIHTTKPICGDAGVTRWFDENYNFMYYDDAVTMMQKVNAWLTRTLR